MSEHNQHWYNPDTGQIECECCCKWALDAEQDKKRIATLTAERDEAIATKEQMVVLHAEIVAGLKSENERMRAVESATDIRLNNRLGELRPEEDDSITGFTEAWDIVRAARKETQLLPSYVSLLARQEAELTALRERLAEVEKPVSPDELTSCLDDKQKVLGPESVCIWFDAVIRARAQKGGA